MEKVTGHDLLAPSVGYTVRMRSDVGRDGDGDGDGKIKALPSLVVFALLISRLWRSRRKGLLALYGNSSTISMVFALSIAVFGQFVAGESWTAREKLGRPARVCGWDN
jgi:hypothetical protein